MKGIRSIPRDIGVCGLSVQYIYGGEWSVILDFLSCLWLIPATQDNESQHMKCRYRHPPAREFRALAFFALFELVVWDANLNLF